MKRTWQLAVHATSLHAVSVTWLGEIQASVRSLPSIPWRDHFFLFFLFSPGIEERIVPFFFFFSEGKSGRTCKEEETKVDLEENARFACRYASCN